MCICWKSERKSRWANEQISDQTNFLNETMSAFGRTLILFAEDIFWPTRDTNTISCKIYIQSCLSFFLPIFPSLFCYLFPFCNDKQNKICIKSIKCFFKRDKYNRNSKQIPANKSRNTKNGDAKSLLHLGIDYLNSSQIQFFFRIAFSLSRSH